MRQAIKWFKTLPSDVQEVLLFKYEGSVPANQKEAVFCIYLNEVGVILL